jgi:hypothetical protein
VVLEKGGEGQTDQNDHVKNEVVRRVKERNILHRVNRRKRKQLLDDLKEKTEY